MEKSTLKKIIRAVRELEIKKKIHYFDCYLIDEMLILDDYMKHIESQRQD